MAGPPKPVDAGRRPSVIAQLRALTPAQRNAFLAGFLGWTLDAFDFFVLVFVIPSVAKSFRVSKTDVAFALTLTLACRPIGAFLFGWLADRYGRRRPLMINVLCYAGISLMCAFAPSLGAFLVLRALFGVAMGGEWGVGAALAMESVPPETRGLLSGLLQEGYVVGYLLAAVVYPLVAPRFGWRAMFVVGVLPALLVLFVRFSVTESPAWINELAQGRTSASPFAVIRQNWRLFGYLVLLMTAFNFMSHGTQDLYPTFLQVQRKLPPATVSIIAVIYNLGALMGGIAFGAWSQRAGRKRAIVWAALLALPWIVPWVLAPVWPLLAVSAFGLQFMVQGAWGVIPIHLSELAPAEMRGTFAGAAYQLGNLFASINAPLQTSIAHSHHGNFALALGSVTAVVVLAVALITASGREAKGARMAAPA